MPRKANHQFSTLTRRSGARRSGLATHILIAGAMSWLAVSGPTVASASPAFPTALRDAAGLECTPVCSVCHTSDPGTSGTASKPFAIAMVEAGLVAADASTVGPAFEELDPDGDGVPEFEGGTASGTAGASGNVFPCQAEVRYGCGVSPKPASSNSSSSGHLLWVGLLALGVGLRRRILGGHSPLSR